MLHNFPAGQMRSYQSRTAGDITVNVERSESLLASKQGATGWKDIVESNIRYSTTRHAIFAIQPAILKLYRHCITMNQHRLCKSPVFLGAF